MCLLTALIQLSNHQIVEVFVWLHVPGFHSPLKGQLLSVLRLAVVLQMQSTLILNHHPVLSA